MVRPHTGFRWPLWAQDEVFRIIQRSGGVLKCLTTAIKYLYGTRLLMTPALLAHPLAEVSLTIVWFTRLNFATGPSLSLPLWAFASHGELLRIIVKFSDENSLGE